ncbi:MAG: PAS domain S-box protein [Acidobacteriota bacterium]
MHPAYTAKLRFLGCVVFGITVFCLFSPTLNAELLPLKNYTSADGLGSSFVSYGMRDSRGFLWFCTRDGLSRFDGSRFVTYQVGDASQPTIENIFETSRGIYWITTTAGLYRYNPLIPDKEGVGNPDRPTLNAQFMSEARGIVFEDKAGVLWFGGDDLYKLEEVDGKAVFTRSSLDLPQNKGATLVITSIVQSRDGGLWLVTTWGLVHRLSDGKVILYGNNAPRTDEFTSVIEDGEGRIWAGRTTGFYVIVPEPVSGLTSGEGLTTRDLDRIAVVQRTDTGGLPQEPGSIVKYTDAGHPANGKYVYRTADGHIWVSRDDGLIESDGRSFVSRIGDKNSLKGVGPMLEDGSGNLWLYLSTGLWRFQRHGFVTYDVSDGLNQPSVVAIGETPDGKVFAGTRGFYLSQFDGARFKTIRPHLPADAAALWTSNAVFRDKEGEWWFLTSDHLYRFGSADPTGLVNEKLPAVYDHQSGLKADQMFHIFEDSHGDIWISNRDASSDGSGLAKWDRSTQAFHSFSENEGFPSKTAISSFAEDASGNLWLGAYEGSLIRYSGGQFTAIGIAKRLGGIITSLLIDKAGLLWIGSSFDGVSVLDISSGQLAEIGHFSTDSGMASNNVRSLVEDLAGNVYAGTARGIDRLTYGSPTIKHFSVSDGLAGDFVSSSFRDNGGSLWFGTSNGLSRLDPGVERRSDPPPIFVGGLRVAGEHQHVSELGTIDVPALDLSYTQNNLQIDFFGIDFNAGKPLRYQYILEGADKDFSQPAEQSTVSYANLGPGKYRFLVRAVSADGVASTQPAMVSFNITPPVWRRWWFIAVIILLAGAGVFGLDRYRITKTRQVEFALGRSIESETRFRALAETASDAIITIDTESNIVFTNDAVEKVFGYSSAELAGKKLTLLMPENFAAKHDAGLERYVETKLRHMAWSGIELPGRHKSGREIPLEVSFGEFDLNGKRYFTGVARDVSERKLSEEALQRSREERFKELERVRTRIATDLHDDIGASLTQIAVLSEVVRSQASPENTEADSQLNRISSLSSDLMQAMGDVVWAINPRNDTLPDLLKRMRRFASDIFSTGGIRFEFDAPQIVDDTAMGANIRREVFAIFKECVNNIARHSDCREARVRLAIDNGILLLDLADDGRGFDTDEKLSDAFAPEIGGNGLINIRRRVGDLGGSCSITSAIGKGANIRIEIPLSADGAIHTSQMAGENGRL